MFATQNSLKSAHCLGFAVSVINSSKHDLFNHISVPSFVVLVQLCVVVQCDTVSTVVVY